MSIVFQSTEAKALLVVHNQLFAKWLNEQVKECTVWKIHKGCSEHNRGSREQPFLHPTCCTAAVARAAGIEKMIPEAGWGGKMQRSLRHPQKSGAPFLHLLMVKDKGKSSPGTARPLQGEMGNKHRQGTRLHQSGNFLPILGCQERWRGPQKLLSLL